MTGPLTVVQDWPVLVKVACKPRMELTDCMCSAMQGPSVEASNDIEKDVTRTFPNTKHFASEEGQSSLRNVLRAYATYDTEVAYCQGMNFIAGLLLMYLTEAESFAAMVVLMEERGLRGVFKKQLGLVQVRLCQQ